MISAALLLVALLTLAPWSDGITVSVGQERKPVAADSRATYADRSLRWPKLAFE